MVGLAKARPNYDKLSSYAGRKPFDFMQSSVTALDTAIAGQCEIFHIMGY